MGRRGWGGEEFLDSLGAGKLREDCYCSRAFDVGTGKPVLWGGGVVCGAMEVDDGNCNWWVFGGRGYLSGSSGVRGFHGCRIENTRACVGRMRCALRLARGRGWRFVARRCQARRMQYGLWRGWRQGSAGRDCLGGEKVDRSLFGIDISDYIVRITVKIKILYLVRTLMQLSNLCRQPSKQSCSGVHTYI